MYIGDIIEKHYFSPYYEWHNVGVPSNADTSLTINYNGLLPEKTELTFPTIEHVLFNDPATIIFWSDGSKTVVKAVNEDFDPEKGLAMAIAKKALGNSGHYYNTIRKWLVEYYLRFPVQTMPESFVEAVEMAKQRLVDLAKALSGKKSKKPEIEWFVECPHNKHKKYHSDSEGMCPCCGGFHPAFCYNTDLL